MKITVIEKNVCIKKFYSSKLYQNGLGYYQPKKVCNTFLFHTIPSEDFWNIVRPSKSLRSRRSGPAPKVNTGESVLRRESVLQGH